MGGRDGREEAGGAGGRKRWRWGCWWKVEMGARVLMDGGDGGVLVDGGEGGEGGWVLVGSGRSWRQTGSLYTERKYWVG